MPHQCKVSVGEVLRQSIRMYRKAPGPLVVLSAISIGSMQAIELLRQKARRIPMFSQIETWANPFWYWAVIATILVCRSVASGENATLGGALRNLYGKFWRYAINRWAAAFLMGLPLLICFPLGSATMMGAKQGTAVAGLLVLLLTFALVPVAWLAMRFWLVGVAACVEPVERGWWTVRRSWHMMRYHVWHALGAMAVVFGISVPGLTLFFLGLSRNPWNAC